MAQQVAHGAAVTAFTLSLTPALLSPTLEQSSSGQSLKEDLELRVSSRSSSQGQLLIPSKSLHRQVHAEPFCRKLEHNPPPNTALLDLLPPLHSSPGELLVILFIASFPTSEEWVPGDMSFGGMVDYLAQLWTLSSGTK